MTFISTWFKNTFINSQTRLIAVLTLIIFVLFLAVGTINYSVSKKILKDEIVFPELSMLTIDRDLADKAIKNVDKTAVEIVLSQAATDFLTSGRDQYDKSGNLVHYLTTLSTANNIESIYVYDIDNRRIAASGSYGYISDISYMPDRDWIDNIQEYNKMTVQKRIVKGKNTEVISLFRPILINSTAKGMLVINLPLISLFSGSTDLEQSDSRSRFIFDAKNNLIAQKNSGGLSAQDVAAAVKQMSGTNNVSVPIDGDNYLLCYLESPYTHWSYVTVIPEKRLFRNIETVRNIIFVVSFGFASIGVAVTVLINNRMLQPIKRMRKLLVHVEKAYNDPEFTDLNNLTSRLLQDHSSMSKQLRTSLPDLQKRFLEDLLYEQTDAVEVYEKWKVYFAGWTVQPLYIAAVSIDHFAKWSKSYSEQDVDLFQYALGNIIEECFADGWRTVCLEDGMHGFIVLLQAKSNESFTDLEDKCSLIIQEAGRYLKMPVSIGLSGETADCLQAAEAYRQSVSVLSWRLYEGYHRVYTPSDHRDEYPERIDDDLQQQLLTSLQAGNQNQAEASLQRLFAFMRSGDNASPSAKIRYLESIQGALKNIAAGLRAQTASNAETFSHPYIGSMSLDDVELYLKELTHFILSGMNQKLVSKQYALLQAMKDYMREHLRDNIGVKDIAESAGVSVYIANQLFKQETSHTVYDYLTKIRIEQSEQLLAETDLKIFEIAEMVGYQNENSFIRVFRIAKNMTPGRYREFVRNEASKSTDVTG